MQIDFSDGRGNVIRCNAKGTYLVKLLFKSSGLYANNVRVLPSKDNPGEWIAYPPAHPVGKGWKGDCEFDRSKPLWKVIEELSIKTVDQYVKKEEALVDDFSNLEEDLSNAFDAFENGHDP